jgi:hypothetical protein
MEGSIDLNKIFGDFEHSRGVVRRVNPPNDLPILDLTGTGKREEKFENIAVKISRTGFSTSNPQIKQVRYLLVKICDSYNLIQRASYLLRTSTGSTHLGIAGKVMRELEEYDPKYKGRIHQSSHHEPVSIAPYVQIEGSGFIAINMDAKISIVYGKSPAFYVKYAVQKEFLLGMTCHEFVSEILKAHLAEWKVVVVNNHAEPLLKDDPKLLTEHYPVSPEVE